MDEDWMVELESDNVCVIPAPACSEMPSRRPKQGEEPWDQMQKLERQE